MKDTKQSEEKRYSRELTFPEKELIKSWAGKGKKQKEIADLLEISPQRVSYTLKTFDSTIFSNRKRFAAGKPKLTLNLKRF